MSAAAAAASDELVLVTSDGEKFTLPRKVAVMSELIKSMESQGEVQRGCLVRAGTAADNPPLWHRCRFCVVWCNQLFSPHSFQGIPI